MDADSSGQLTPDFDRQKRRLLAEVREGSPAALAELLEMYRPFLRIWGRRPAGDLLRRKFDTSDVIQNTQRFALEQIDAFQAIADEDFSARLREMLHAQISASRKRYWRVQKRNVGREQPLDGFKSWDHLVNLAVTPPDAVTHQVSQAELRARMEALLGQLSVDMQDLIRQRLWESRTWDEIASLHDCSEDAARMRFARAIARFARLYRREHPDV